MQKTLKLWGRATSYNVQKVAWVLAELGLECPRIDAGGAFGGLDDPDYVALNPNKRVPTLMDGALVLWESNTICRYLVNAYASSHLFGRDHLQDHARADMWMDWFQSTVYANSIALFYQTVRLPPSKRSIEKKEACLAALSEAFSIFEDSLNDRRFILGDQLSLGDIPMGAFLYRYFTMDIARPDLPNIARYYSDLSQRPTYQNAVMVDYSSLRGAD